MFKLNNNVSVFTAEATEILEALNSCYNSSSRMKVLMIDSAFSVLNAIENRKFVLDTLTIVMELLKPILLL